MKERNIELVVNNKVLVGYLRQKERVSDSQTRKNLTRRKSGCFKC